MQAGKPSTTAAHRATAADKITRYTVAAAAVPALLVGLAAIGILLALGGRGNDGPSKASLGALRTEQAQLTAATIDSFIAERMNDTIDWGRDDTIVSAVSTDAASTADRNATQLPLTSLTDDDATLPAERQVDTAGTAADWLRSRVEDDETIVQALVTDSEGFTVAAANPTDDATSADHEWWQQAWSTGAHIGRVEVHDAMGAVFPLAVRVDDPVTGAPLGVLHAVATTTSVQSIADGQAGDARGIDVSVISGNGVLLAETASAHDPTRTGGGLPGGDVHVAAHAAALAAQDMAGPVTFDGEVGGFGRTDPAASMERPDIAADGAGWVVLVVPDPTATALAPSGTDLSTMAILLALASALLVLGAVIGGVLAGRRLAASITGPIRQLGFEANRVAEVELPELATSLKSTNTTEGIPTFAPIFLDGDIDVREVSDLADAFNSVRATAMGIATEQAIGRSQDLSDLLTSLGRRNQQLVGRQLRYIDDLERDESDPDALRNLFVLDQMATRMRRNAESLLVLAGEDSPRKVSEPRPIEEVIRAAISEVEDYARVRLIDVEPAKVLPDAVNDLTHLLAELIENATSFSPSEEFVDVCGAAEADGRYTLSIIDVGVGMTGDRLVEANDRLQAETYATDGRSTLLGLHVVGRLAARHGIDAQLAASGEAGTAATVVLPPSCLVKALPVAEVTGSRLHTVDSTPETDNAATTSWPPPAVEHATPLPAAPRSPKPAAAALADAAATGDGRRMGEDESVGLPIPPFRARESKRSNGVSDPLGGGNHSERAPIGPPRPQGLDTDVTSPEDRAAEVRAKLDRFADGVRAAKTETAETETTDAETTGPAPDAEDQRHDDMRHDDDRHEVGEGAKLVSFGSGRTRSLIVGEGRAEEDAS